jgi:hypothetical protein
LPGRASDGGRSHRKIARDIERSDVHNLVVRIHSATGGSPRALPSLGYRSFLNICLPCRTGSNLRNDNQKTVSKAKLDYGAVVSC